MASAPPPFRPSQPANVVGGAVPPAPMAAPASALHASSAASAPAAAAPAASALSAAASPVSGMPPALAAQLKSLEEWAQANRSDARRDTLRFWMLKIPAILVSASSGVFAYFKV